MARPPRHGRGTGHLYQGRFKSFPVQPDGRHVRAVARYVGRNALRAGLVRRAEEWRWSRPWRREHGAAAAAAPGRRELAATGRQFSPVTVPAEGRSQDLKQVADQAWAEAPKQTATHERAMGYLEKLANRLGPVVTVGG